MRSFIVTSIMLVSFCIGSALYADDVAGIWSGSTGKLKFVLTIKQTGNDISGSIAFTHGENDHIKGTVNGKQVTFTRWVNAVGKKTQTWKGTISPSGNTISGQWKGVGGNAPFDAMRN